MNKRTDHLNNHGERSLLLAASVDGSLPVTPRGIAMLRRGAANGYPHMGAEDRAIAERIFRSSDDEVAAHVRGGGIGEFVWRYTKGTLPLIAGVAGTAASGSPLGGIAAATATRAGLELIDSLMGPHQ